MDLTVNGDDATVADATTVAALVAERVPTGAPVAVARNGEVVPRARWGATLLAPGDAIELLTAVPGG